LLFDPSSVEEIAACMEKLWADDELCTMLSTKGKMHSEKWGPTQFNQAFLEIIRRVVALATGVNALEPLDGNRRLQS